MPSAPAPPRRRPPPRLDVRADTAIVADTGGTTYDVSLVRRGSIPMTPETWLGQRYRGHILGFPSVDVRSIGAGGGGSAWVDEGGLLQVGPMSADAGQGTDSYAMCGSGISLSETPKVLGYVDPAYFL